MSHDLIDKSKDDESPYVRVTRALRYCDRFDYDYMLEEGYYYNTGHGLDDKQLEDFPFMFVTESFE
jgi:hypothetical protein